uniref:Fe2OG dioxygenase domain-containing protein n=1 Tax=Amphora coffeiformis TaxID=265554 RepID=A0A7S3L7Z8_9STRA|eukprot:scaffold45428_cov176-Amphora_coffeaeformis.AAC.2
MSAEIEVADSRFLGFCAAISSAKDAKALQNECKVAHPSAAHVALAWVLTDGTTTTGFDEDGEPPESTGPSLVQELQAADWNNDNDNLGMAVVIVRYFGERLLGVTCGRLSQCYASIARLTLHRHIQGDKLPLEQEFMDPTLENIYGLAGGDSELILNVVDDPQNELLYGVKEELNFDGFLGAKEEVLPRLQNMQGTVKDDVIPAYRYPGNYTGEEWKTFSWSPKSTLIKEAVEQALRPLWNQTMNHCVANYYRNGDDFIAHHSDKDLDLNREGVIVSVSLGEGRIMELRRRAEPKDTTRVLLPHGSMLVLGPKTNEKWTHSILKKKDSTMPRISLTTRDCKTFMDMKTKRLFGQGTENKTLESLRLSQLVDNTLFVGAISLLCAATVGSKKWNHHPHADNLIDSTSLLLVGGLFTGGFLSFQKLRAMYYKRRDEKSAREFFSKKSAGGTKYS